MAADKKVVVITGCSSGIGRALSEEFHRRGFRVIATARRLGALDELKAKGVGVEQLDVTNATEVRKVVDAIAACEGRIDILVNNAGYGLMGPTLDLPPEELRLQFETNVFAPLLVATRVAAGMRARGGGMIVNIGSVSGVVTTPFAGAYCASKAALHAFSDALRMELAPFGIRVITVQPGGIRSDFGTNSARSAERMLRPDSWYSKVRDAILSRAQVSQTDAMPASTFARRLVRIIEAKNPPPIVRLGPRSHSLPFLKRALPARLLDAILSRRFGLTSI